MNLTVTCQTGYSTETKFGEHVLRSDEPKEQGGENTGASPTAMLLMALGSCKAITLRMYANRKGWHLGGMEIRLEMVEQRIDTFMKFEADLTEEQNKRLMKIASKCPVSKMLSKGTMVLDQVDNT